VTFKGGALTLLGSEVRVGDRAPDFQVLGQDLSPVTLASGKGKVRILSIVPSLDTPVCDQQTRRFNQEASRLPDGVEVWTISMDLPFAQKRWCGAAGVDRVKVFSDHREASFGLSYGCLVKELRLLARAIFVIDATDTVRYVEYVPEVTSHPNYDRALAAVRQLLG
jgi:thiol peroxidase